MSSSRFLLLCSLFAFASAAPSGVRADDALTVDRIFALHEKAVGYSASDGLAKPFIKISTTTLRDYQGHTHEVKSVRYQAGPDYRVDSTYLGATSSAGFDDGGFWSASANDNITAPFGFERVFLVTNAVVEAEAFDSTLSAELRRAEGPDEVVRIHPPSGLPADIYFNRITWLIDRMIIDPDGWSLRYDYSDYKREGAIMVATVRRRGGGETRPVDYDVDKVTDFKWDAAFSSDEFSPPKVKHYVTFPASGRATLPFDFHGGVIVEAAINGAVGRLLIDPSESGLMINSLLASKAGLLDEKTEVPWVGEVFQNSLATVSFGDVRMKDVRLSVLDGNYLGLYDGILGFDVFAQAVVDIDFPKRTISFVDPTKFTPSPDRHGLPLLVAGGAAEVLVRANGSEPMMLQFQPSVAGQLVLWGGVVNNTTFAQKIGLKHGYLDELDIGPNTLRHVRVESGGWWFNPWMALTGSMGLLEGEILQQYDVTFDYPGAVVYIDKD